MLSVSEGVRTGQFGRLNGCGRIRSAARGPSRRVLYPQPTSVSSVVRLVPLLILISLSSLPLVSFWAARSRCRLSHCVYFAAVSFSRSKCVKSSPSTLVRPVFRSVTPAVSIPPFLFLYRPPRCTKVDDDVSFESIYAFISFEERELTF